MADDATVAVRLASRQSYKVVSEADSMARAALSLNTDKVSGMMISLSITTEEVGLVDELGGEVERKEEGARSERTNQLP